MHRLLLAYCFIFFGLTYHSQTNFPLEIVVQRGHVKPIICAAYSPDGNYVATGSSDNSIKLWNASTGKEIRSFNEHTGMVKSVCFSKDGKRLLSAGTDNKIIIQNIFTSKPETVFSIDEDMLVKALFNFNETKILAANNEGKYWVFDLSSNEKQGPYKKSHKAIITQNWFGNNNQTVIFKNYKETLIFNLDSNKVVQNIAPEKSFSYAFSPDGKFLTVGSTKLFAEIFEVATGIKSHTLHSSDSVKCDGCNTVVQYSHTGKTLVTGAKKGGLILWDPKKGIKIKVFENNVPERIRSVTYSGNDSYLLVESDSKITVYNTKSGKSNLEIKRTWNSRFQPSFSPDGKNIITPGINNTTNIWSVITGRKVKILKGYLNHENKGGLSYSYNDWYSTGILRYLNMKSSTAISPTQPYFVRGGIDSSCVLINWQTGRIVKTFNGHSKVVFCYDFSPDGKTVVTGGGDSYLILWSVDSGKEIKKFKGHRDLIFDVKFNSDGTQLISGSWDGTMITWDVTSGEILQKMRLDNAAPYVVDFAPNDLYGVSGDLGKKFKFWELDAGKEFRSIIGNTNIVGAFDFSPGGENMVTACWDGKVKIWDVLTGMLVQKFSQHKGAATSVIYNQNRIISGGADRNIYIWNSENKKIEQTLTGHAAAITDLKITHNGEALISCSADGVMKIWNLKTYKELYTYVQIDKDNWLVTNPQGYFDGSAKAQKLVNYVSGLQVVPIGSLFKKYYTPNLLKRIMQGEQFEETSENINNEIKSSPMIKLTLNGDGETPLKVVGDSVYKFRNKNVALTLSVSGERSVDNMVRIYNNGKLIISNPFLLKYHLEVEIKIQRLMR